MAAAAFLMALGALVVLACLLALLVACYIELFRNS